MAYEKALWLIELDINQPAKLPSNMMIWEVIMVCFQGQALQAPPLTWCQEDQEATYDTSLQRHQTCHYR